jgi:lambda family phage minor tail protein L
VTDTVIQAAQRLEPGARVRLYQFDMRPITGGGAGDVLYFHGYPQAGTITWQGVAYSPAPIETEGFEKTGDQQPVPKVRIGNIGGAISTLCYQYQDLLGAELTVHDTYEQFLDGQPGADPTQEHPPELWIVERKSLDTSDVVEFELSNAMDVGTVQLPRRQMIADVCTWITLGGQARGVRSGYRGPYCGYTGGPVATVNDVATTDPAADDCSGTLTGCRFRFGQNGPLPFGGFPATSLTRT